MPLLPTAFVLLSLLLTAHQPNPVDSWLRAPSTSLLEATYAKEHGTLQFGLTLNQDFDGELAIISSSGENLYQRHHHFGAGKRKIFLDIPKPRKQQCLVIFHDFDRRSLQTMKIMLD